MTDPASATDTEADELMRRYAITRVPSDQYHYMQWRYSNLRDAIAQAKRDSASSQ